MLDVTNPSSPLFLSSCGTPGHPNTLYTLADTEGHTIVAYLACGGAGLRKLVYDAPGGGGP